VKRLQVFAADLKGPDGPSLNGWQEVERYGVEITRAGGMIVLAGKQSRPRRGHDRDAHRNDAATSTASP
jgi:hypothetical protein